MNKWSRYQLKAKDTACFPSICVEDEDGLYSEAEYVYPLMGLIGEIGEVATLAGKASPIEEIRDDLKYELGDVLWYLAELATAIGFDLSEAVDSPFLKNTAEPASGSVLWLRDWLYSLLLKAADVSEVLKKVVRDHDGRLYCEDQRLVGACITDALVLLQRVAGVFSLSLDEVAEANLAKLASRKERGVIQGQGSDR